MTRTEELDAIVARYDLNTHPFYQEWVAGTLPTAKLASYAAEYGHFIGTVAEGWDAVGYPEVAEEERGHESLWSDFRAAIGAGSELKLAGTAALVETSHRLYGKRATAVGALYAFEAQQPHTSASKLKGLKDHYAVTGKGLTYFQVHAGDDSEPQMLLREANKLSEEDFTATKKSCEKMGAAMWAALDAVYA